MFNKALYEILLLLKYYLTSDSSLYLRVAYLLQQPNHNIKICDSLLAETVIYL